MAQCLGIPSKPSLQSQNHDVLISYVVTLHIPYHPFSSKLLLQWNLLRSEYIILHFSSILFSLLFTTNSTREFVISKQKMSRGISNTCK